MARYQKPAKKSVKSKQKRESNQTTREPHLRDANHQAELISGPPGMLAGTDVVQAQSDRLGDPRLQTGQRQSLAVQIGRRHGNRHLQRLMLPPDQSGLELEPQPLVPAGPGQTNVIARWYDDGPYTPGEMSRLYHELPAGERAEVNAEVDRRFAAETGITRKLDPNNPEDAGLINVWLRIRDAVMAERVGEPEEPTPEEPKKEEPTPEEPKPEEPTPEEPKPEPPKTGLSYEEAKKQIEAAGKGWGTDEAGIYAAIRQCYEREKLAADPAVQALLEDELSGHDLWKAQLLLAFGSEAAYPQPIKEIWSATEGWGTDEERIYQALQKLNAAEVAAISKVPGLRAMLEDELSGKDLKAAEDLLSGDYAKAIDRHKENVAEMTTQLNNMKSGTPIERNTAEWLAPSTPGATPKNDLHVATLTHDAPARAKEHGYGNDFQAYFGAQEIHPDDSATYDPHIGSTRNIRFVKKGTGGHHLNRDIWIYEPKRQGAGGVKMLLIHEVQHDADRHDDEAGHGGRGPKEAWNRYKTEFRAYWQDGRYDGISDATDPSLAPWDNARQKTIKDNMVSSGLYEWLDKNYKDDDAKVDGKKFKDLVHSYARPEGVNLENSPRIDDFYRRLDGCKKSDTDLTDSPLKELEAAANQLDAHDQAYVNSEQAVRLQQMMKDNLVDAVLVHMATIVNGGTLPAWVNAGTP